MNEPYIREYTELPAQEKRQLNYKRKFKEEYPGWDDSMILLRDLVAEEIPSGGSALDLGCGHGNFILDELKGHFTQTVGLDVDEQVAAHNTSVEKVLYGNADQIPLPDESINTVLSLWVMEHVENPDLVFGEIARVLKPGGHYAFVTPNAQALIVQLRTLVPYKLARKLVRKLYGRAEEDTFQIQYRANTMHDLEAFAQKYGFDIVYLAQNADPSYTSFDPISYRLSAWLAHLPGGLFKPHLIAIFQKQ